MSRKLETDINYMEGNYAVPRMITRIEDSEYKTVEGAIAAKQELIKNFEDEFGYTPDEYKEDPAYAYNYGLLDGLLSSQTTT